MPVSLDQRESDCRIRLEGQITIASAAELKNLLVNWAATGKDLALDLTRAEEIDISTLQLLWSAAREAARTGRHVGCAASPAAISAAQSAGFPEFPGLEHERHA